MDIGLIRSIRDNDSIAFKRLLDRGANPRTFDRKGYSSVHLCCMYDAHRVLQVLLDLDPSIIYEAAKDSSLPLEWAARNASVESFRVLSRHKISLDHVLDISCLDSSESDALFDRHSPLAIALKSKELSLSKRLDCVASLVGLGANLN